MSANEWPEFRDLPLDSDPTRETTRRSGGYVAMPNYCYDLARRAIAREADDAKHAAICCDRAAHYREEWQAAQKAADRLAEAAGRVVDSPLHAPTCSTNYGGACRCVASELRAALAAFEASK